MFVNNNNENNIKNKRKLFSVSPHLCQNIRTLSVKHIRFIVIGGDVRATQDGTNTRAVFKITDPLTIFAGAVKQRSVSSSS